MNLLAIDTSTEHVSVALSIGESIRSVEQSAQRQHAHVLLPMIERLLAEAEFSLSQLDAIVYGRGPGSFTGLRIACSVAKGLAYAHDLPLFPVSSLAAIADEVLQQDQNPKNATVLAMIDARMNQLYWACFTGSIPDVEEHVTAPTAILAPADNPLILAGVGYESYLSQLSSNVQTRISNHLTIYPKAQTMIGLAQTGSIKAISALEALPVYIRNQITQGEPRG